MFALLASKAAACSLATAIPVSHVERIICKTSENNKMIEDDEDSPSKISFLTTAQPSSPSKYPSTYLPSFHTAPVHQQHYLVSPPG